MIKILEDKVIVITGGAGLLGKAFVDSIIYEGGKVVIADINISHAKEVRDELTDKYDGAEVEAIELNITSKLNILECLDKISNKYGKIDALINNAYPRNRNYGRHLEEVEYHDFSENLALNLGGYFLMTQQFSLFFKNQGFGNVINVSSIYGVIPPKFEVYEGTTMTMPVEYAAIKSGLIHMTKYFAKYYKSYNIRYNCLSPGGILDNQDESFVEKYGELSLNKGMLHKEDLSGTLVYLLSDMSKFVNGQNIVVDDGFTL